MSRLKLGSIDCILNEIFSFICYDYKRLIVKHAPPVQERKMHVKTAINSLLHNYFENTILKSEGRRKVLEYAAASGSLELFMWTEETCGVQQLRSVIWQ
jgi:hypothetical protein